MTKKVPPESMRVELAVRRAMARYEHIDMGYLALEALAEELHFLDPWPNFPERRAVHRLRSKQKQ